MWNIPLLFICLFMCLLVCMFKNRFSGSWGWFFVESSELGSSSLSQRCLSLVWFSLCRVTAGPPLNKPARRRFLLGSFRAPSDNILRALLPFSSRTGFVRDTRDVCCFQLWKIKLFLSARSFDPPENLSELPTARSKSSRPRDAGTLTGHSAGCYRNKDSVGTEMITLDFISSFSSFDLFILNVR